MTASTVSPKPRRISAGRPKPFDLCSVFVLMPDSDMKLDDRSMRAAFEQMGQESLFKGIERLSKRRPAQISNRLVRSMAAMLEKSPMPELADAIRRALDGDPEAIAQLEAMGGSWGAFRLGKGNNIPLHERVVLDHCAEVEQASAAAYVLLREGDFRGAADAIAANTLTSPYMSDAALESLAQAGTPVQALPARLAGVCELLLSLVARVDQEVSATGDPSLGGDFEPLLRLGPKGQCHPGRELIRWMQAKLSAGTLAVLLDKGGSDPVIDESTLKRWSSGQEFPSEAKLSAFVRSVLKTRGDAASTEFNAQSIETRFWAARRLHRLLELVRRIHEGVLATSTPMRWMQLLGDTTPESWCRRRYAFWVAHWRSQDPAYG